MVTMTRMATEKVQDFIQEHGVQGEVGLRVAVLPGGSPYRPDDALSTRGTLDKLFINGHYYSDKSPVPALFMAGVYAALQALTGLTARDRPDLFCWALTLLTSGVAYVVAVWSVFRLGSTSPSASNCKASARETATGSATVATRTPPS